MLWAAGNTVAPGQSPKTMVHDLHIVVVDDLKGGVQPLYVGTDDVKATKVFDEAKDVEAVRLIQYPQATRLRYPAEEVAAAKRRAEDAKEAALKLSQANVIEAAALEAQAKELAEKAKALRSTK